MFEKEGGVKSLSDSTARLIEQDIVKAELQVKAFVQDIRACTGPVELLNTLNMQVSEHMRTMKTGMCELETLAQEQEREAEKLELTKRLDQFQSQFAANQLALRKANLACQTHIDRHNREELLHGPVSTSEENPRQRRRADKDGLAKQSSSITDSLVALSTSMHQQVRESEESLRSLASSSSVVTETGEELKSMAGVVRQARSLLQKYGRREITDKVLMALAVIFFISCVAYVVHKRLF